MFKVKSTNMHATYTTRAQIFARFALRLAVFELQLGLNTKSYVGDIFYVGLIIFYEGPIISYIGDMIYYVGDNKAYVGLTKSYVEDNIFYVRRR